VPVISVCQIYTYCTVSIDGHQQYLHFRCSVPPFTKHLACLLSEKWSSPIFCGDGLALLFGVLLVAFFNNVHEEIPSILVCLQLLILLFLRGIYLPIEPGAFCRLAVLCLRLLGALE